MICPCVKFNYASTTDGVIGKNNKLPWYVPEDLKLFKEKTLGHIVMMGRNTYESLPPSIRPMPNRTNIVVSRNKDLKIPGVTVISDPIAYIFKCKQPIWVIGGAQLYKDLEHLCTEVHHTEVLSSIEGDAHFKFNTEGWDMAQDSGVLTSSSGLDYRIRVWTLPLLMTRY